MLFFFVFLCFFSTVGWSTPIHAIVVLIIPHPFLSVLPCNDEPRVEQAGNPPQDCKKDVEAKVGAAALDDQDGCWRNKDGEDV